MSETLQKNISFSLKVQMEQAKMNSYLHLPVYSLICMSDIKNENITNNQELLHAAYLHKHQKMTMNNISISGGLTYYTQFWS